MKIVLVMLTLALPTLALAGNDKLAEPYQMTVGDMIALGIVKCGCGSRRLLRLNLELRKRHLQMGPLREDHGALNQVL